MPKVQIFDDLTSLPDSYMNLFEEAAAGSFYCSFSWFDNLSKTVADSGDRLRLYGLASDGGGTSALALLVTRRATPEGERMAERELDGYSTMYTTLYSPVLRPTGIRPEEAAACFATAIASESPAWEVARFDSMDGESPFFPAFADALGQAGMVVQTYFHFGNAFEEFETPSIEDYLKKRPSNLRNTLKRKGKKLGELGKIRCDIITGGEGLEATIAAYETVYAASWKDPEPYPDFTRGLVLGAARDGCLRMGVIYADDTPIAAQIWIVAGGAATIFKLAYDEDYKKSSAGSILTLRLMEHVVEVDEVREVDFGRGDDHYKFDWLAQRRERWGIVAFNPWTIRGGLGALKNVGGRALKTMLGRTTQRTSPTS